MERVFFSFFLEEQRVGTETLNHRLSSKKSRRLRLQLLLSLIGYYLIGGSFMCLLVSSGMLVYFIQMHPNKSLNNKIIGIVSAFSMEIYLSHMAIFQLIKKIHINELLGNGWIQYIMTVWVVLCGSMIFSMIVRWVFTQVKNKMHQ